MRSDKTMMHRPHTAVTNDRNDEIRIQKKMRALENIERKIQEDFEEFQSRKFVPKDQ